ncbi:MAG: GNAT family N-acetyltransferase [Alloprevotella sp.]|nr:GNAT family N-acetyltransferase [Alloprevotella sp.]
MERCDTAISVEIRPARREEAPAIAHLIMEAMSEASCHIICGPHRTLDELHALLTELVRAEVSQYSYRNTLVAVVADGSVAGIAVSYDGGQLHRLRRPFIEAARTRLGQDYSAMADETQPGELYLDSFAVRADLRRRGIGVELLWAVKRRAASLGLSKVGLLVDKGNPLAERIYLSAGFRWENDTEWFSHPMRHLACPVPA